MDGDLHPEAEQTQTIPEVTTTELTVIGGTVKGQATVPTQTATTAEILALQIRMQGGTGGEELACLQTFPARLPGRLAEVQRAQEATGIRSCETH